MRSSCKCNNPLDHLHQPKIGEKVFSPQQKDADRQHQYAYVCVHMAVPIMCECGQCVQCMHEQCECVCVCVSSAGMSSVSVCSGVGVRPVCVSSTCMTSVGVSSVCVCV